jgi:tRNA pseudouridine38-40 synthase
MKKNIRLVVEYDGSAYAGWQRQPEDPSIQGVLEGAVAALTGEESTLHGSGRTDSGVHALGQVANFVSNSSIPPDRFAPALNSVLPPDIRILESAEVSGDFHSRFSARNKTYLYRVCTSPHSPAILRKYCHHFPHRLDRDLVSEAAEKLRGAHDFAGFSSSGSDVKSTARNVNRFEVAWADPILAFVVAADGFLYRMVRSMVGTILEIGRGKLAPSSVDEALDSKDRGRAGPTAPPEGLFLAGVAYDGWKTPLQGESPGEILRRL